MADSAAKTAQNNPLDTLFKIPFTDLKRTINIYTKQKWQIYWDNFQNNKLHEIMPQITKKSNQNVQKRRNNIIKIKNKTLTHYPFIPPLKRRGSILHTMTKAIYY